MRAVNCSQGVKGIRVKLSVFNAHAEFIFYEQAQVNQAERIDQAIGQQGLIRAQGAFGLLEDLGDDIGIEGCEDFFGHGVVAPSRMINHGSTENTEVTKLFVYSVIRDGGFVFRG